MGFGHAEFRGTPILSTGNNLPPQTRKIGTRCRKRHGLDWQALHFWLRRARESYHCMIYRSIQNQFFESRCSWSWAVTWWGGPVGEHGLEGSHSSHHAKTTRSTATSTSATSTATCTAAQFQQPNCWTWAISSDTRNYTTTLSFRDWLWLKLPTTCLGHPPTHVVHLKLCLAHPTTQQAKQQQWPSNNLHHTDVRHPNTPDPPRSGRVVGP